MSVIGNDFLQLGWKDLAKGFIMAVLFALATGIYQAIDAGTILFTWVFFKPIVLTSVGAGLLYLIKNFFTNSDDKFLTKKAG